jgi:hypothetical protein
VSREGKWSPKFESSYTSPNQEFRAGDESKFTPQSTRTASSQGNLKTTQLIQHSANLGEVDLADTDAVTRSLATRAALWHHRAMPRPAPVYVEVPALWIEEMAGVASGGQIVHLAISWNPAVDPIRLKEKGVGLEELTESFNEGFSIREAMERGVRSFYLWTRKFEMNLDPVLAENSRKRMAQSKWCQPSRQERPPGPLQGRLTFEADSDEVECDLDQVVAAAEEAVREREKHESSSGDSEFNASRASR